MRSAQNKECNAFKISLISFNVRITCAASLSPVTLNYCQPPTTSLPPSFHITHPKSKPHTPDKSNPTHYNLYSFKANKNTPNHNRLVMFGNKSEKFIMNEAHHRITQYRIEHPTL